MTNTNSTNSPKFTTIDLFAGGGGCFIGFEQAGFENKLYNEFNKNVAAVFKHNFPNVNAIVDDIASIDFKPYAGLIDVVVGAPPCQSFSSAGKQEGLSDPRGLMFMQYARCLDEVKPKMFVFENVFNLLTHNKGESLRIIRQHFKDQGYKTLVKVLNANDFGVAQNRNRLIIYGVRDDLDHTLFKLPEALSHKPVINDVFKAGSYYSTDVETLEPTDQKKKGYLYTERRHRVMSYVPEGGDYRSLPENDPIYGNVRKDWMGAMYESTKHKKDENRTGNSGIARRLSRNRPSPTTLTCCVYKRNEFCHPVETRPLTVREYARVQSWPDHYELVPEGKQFSISNAYYYIGNSTPPQMVYYALALPIKNFLTKLNESLGC